ncbi:MAG: hypothetical protein ABDH28_06200 [Brevinematia bacterium]
MKKVLSVLFVLGTVFSANALFEPVFVGGKYVGLGGANIVEVQDPYAMVYNPAGLSYIDGISVSVSYSEPFGTPGMNLINANLAGNLVDILQLGVNVSYYGADLNSTSGLRYLVVGVGVGRSFSLSDVISFVDDLRVGLSAKGLMISLAGYELDTSVNGSKMGFSADAGVGVSLMKEFLKVGVVGYNLVPNSFSFFSDSTNVTEVYSAVKFGVSVYLVRPYMKIFGAYGMGLNSASPSSLSVGTELSYADTIFTRIGLNEGKLTMGLGIKAPNFEINFGVQNRDNLGWYYQIDLVSSVKLF